MKVPVAPRARLLVAGMTVVAASAGAWGLWRARPSGGGGPFPDAPIVLISIDTLRADRLPAYGYGTGATPALDGLARDGIVFEDVYSHCPLTTPAHASLFTGLLPPRHGVRNNVGFTLAPSHKTLATRFHEAGLETGAAVSAFVMRRATGLSAGFDFYDDAVETDSSRESLGDQQRDGALAVESLARWVEGRAGRRFFAFLHLYEPHAPWTPPEAHREHAHPYDGEVAYADELVGRFLARLNAFGALDRAIVAVTSDHGEGLGDHGEAEHGLFLYREAVRVPFIVRLPGARRRGTRVAGVVAQSDIAATLLDLAGLGAEGMDGVSQRASIGAVARARPVYSETLFPRYHFGWSELFAVTDDRLRYIRAPRPELFDVKVDPGEKSNLADARPAAVTAMAAWLDAQGAAALAPAPAAVSAEVRERLEALGYVGSAPPSATTTGGARADPKDKIAAYEAFKAAHALRGEGKDAEAAQALERVLADSPDMLDARETLGLTLFRLGRDGAAIAALDAVVAAEPGRGSAHLALARLYAQKGRRDAVERHALLAVAAIPGEAYEMLAQLRLDERKLDEAEALARRSVEADPTRAVAHYVLGLVARHQERCEDALAALARAEEARSRQRGFVMPGLFSAKGDCLARLGREAEAERAFLEEIREFPFSRQGRMGLAILYRSQSKDEAAREALAGVVTSHPRPGQEEYRTVVKTLAVLGDRAAALEWAARARVRFPADKRFRPGG